MRFFTLLAGYAAGLAIAMKYRKDSGNSKLDTLDPTKSKIDSFIDEVVDIHKTAFTNIASFARENFDDVQNFDDLKDKVSTVVSTFTANLESHIEAVKSKWVQKKDELLKIAQDFYASHEATLQSAKTKAVSFSGIPEATIDSWLATARHELQSAYRTIESQILSYSDTISDTVVASKPSQKKSTPKAPTV